MFKSTTLTRFRRHLLVAAVAAAAIVPAAGAVTRPPDVQDTASANLAAQLSPPDVRDAALRTSVVVPDVFERYAAAHPFGSGLSSLEVAVSRPPDVQDAALGSSVAIPDAIERYAAAHPYGTGLSSSEAVVSRPPDVADAALTAQYGTVGGSTTSFDWGDWAIGIGSGIGMALLLGAGLATSRQVRQRVRTA
ncbi:MAG TPA: hypothetical protein VFA24_01570 [Gaiellaceae bacterium]|nr:hypothetical protein [Gaiellaceae bacterium]